MIQSWVSEPKNTARSMLVTIFGDTVLPIGREIWLSQLFQLTEVFGFAGRLVRTSMFRLASEGWFTNERVGRKSQYSLTRMAIEESEQAAKRIYHSPHPNWSEEWTVVFLDAPSVSASIREQLARHLRWHGFILLSRGLLGSPNESLESTQDLCRRIALDVNVPLAVLTFSELESLVVDGFFVEALDMTGVAEAYDKIVHFYGPLVDSSNPGAPAEAFALRSMLIHDLRRIKLSGPDIPAALLPTGWAGDAADEVARQLYPQLSTTAAPWLSEVLDTKYPRHFANRF